MRTRPEPASTLPAPATPDRRSTPRPPTRAASQRRRGGGIPLRTRRIDSCRADPRTLARKHPLTDDTVMLLERPRPVTAGTDRPPRGLRAESSSQAPAATARGRSAAVGVAGPATHGRLKALVPGTSTASRTHCLFRAKHSAPRPLPDAHRLGFDRWCSATPLIIDPFGRGPGENDGLNWPHCDGVRASEAIALSPGGSRSLW